MSTLDLAGEVMEHAVRAVQLCGAFTREGMPACPDLPFATFCAEVFRTLEHAAREAAERMERDAAALKAVQS